MAGRKQVYEGFVTKTSTISNTAVAISAAGWSWGSTDLASAERAVITAFTAGVVVTWDGTTPTATLGRAVAQNGTLTIEGTGNIANISMIRAASTDATVSVTLEK